MVNRYFEKNEENSGTRPESKRKGHAGIGAPAKELMKEFTNDD